MWKSLWSVCFVCLPSFLITDCSVSFTLHAFSMLFTSNLQFLSSVYLSIALQSNVGCCNVGLLVLVPCLLALLQPQIYFPHSQTHGFHGLCCCLCHVLCYSFLFSCHTLLYYLFLFYWHCLVCVCLFLMSTQLRLLLLIPYNVTCLSKDNTNGCSYSYLLLAYLLL